MTASILFDTIGIAVEPVLFDQALALEKLKSGEIAAMVYVAGKPVTLFNNLSGQEGLHFVPIEYTPNVLETYLPSRFTHEDYPQLVADGQEVQTLAVGAVMAVYNWQPKTVRHRKVARFIDAFFSHFADFQKPPRHSKWQEVSLTASVPGWERFKPAEDWLKSNLTGESLKASPDLRKAFADFLQQESPSPASRQLTDNEKDQLFQQFLRWYNRQDQ